VQPFANSAMIGWHNLSTTFRIEVWEAIQEEHFDIAAVLAIQS